MSDSSLLLKLAIPEHDSERAEALWDGWTDSQIEIAVPDLIGYEFVSAVRQAVRRQRITPARSEEAIQTLLSLPVVIYEMRSMHRAAWDLATRMDLASTYDAHYLALADALNCEFWTADARLHASVADRFPLIRLLGA
ncbi:MAG: type II toxin-antitoxin system VapC family toxin [Chloroflexota bacterium]